MQIFMTNPAVSNNPAAPKPFFQVVQERFKQIVLAALTLYVALIGLKIITAGQPPSRGEAVMYVVKFGLVLFFATGDAWYRIEDGKRVGIYPAILDTSEELASIFLEAQNVNDPLKMCYLPYGNNGQNILANKDISIGTSGTATEGYPGYIKTTVWDLVDCKVVNYLSFGSCDYSLKGLMSAWLGAGMIFTNFALAISLIIYSIMTLITVFKFAHIFILSMFTITILVFLSPIFILFALFEPTKAMFQSWMKMIIGYMLYPALLFAFVAIMFATFDSIMYGDLDFSDTDIEDASNAPTTTFENIRADTRSGIKAACAKVRSSSIYCENLAYAAVPDPCVSVGSALSTDLIEKKNVTGFGDYQKVSDDYASAIQPHVGKMLLFSFLFYLFLGSITEFMAAIVGVRGLGNESQGLSAPLAPMKMAAGAAASKIAGGAARAVGKRAAGNKRN